MLVRPFRPGLGEGLDFLGFLTDLRGGGRHCGSTLAVLKVTSCVGSALQQSQRVDPDAPLGRRRHLLHNRLGVYQVVAMIPQ